MADVFKTLSPTMVEAVIVVARVGGLDYYKARLLGVRMMTLKALVKRDILLETQTTSCSFLTLNDDASDSEEWEAICESLHSLRDDGGYSGNFFSAHMKDCRDHWKVLTGIAF